MKTNKKIKKLEKEKKSLIKNLKIAIHELDLDYEQLMESAHLISYQAGQIAAYRDCLGLKD